MKIIFFPLLFLLTFFYRAGLVCDRLLKTRGRIRLPRPVISIGNLTWGGTGKTPLLLSLLSHLAELHLKPAVLTRGYRGAAQRQSISEIYMGGFSHGDSVSDEVRLVARRFPFLPIGVGPSRVESARKIFDAYDLDIFILDDGFQHWLVERDLDVVCVDASCPWGNKHLIPLGFLRETPSALKRADAIVLTRAELITNEERQQLIRDIRSYAGDKPVLTSRSHVHLFPWNGEKPFDPTFLQGKKVLAVSAIGRPEAYERTLAQMGAQVIPYRYRDHHQYRENDLRSIQRKANQEQALVIVTEKDEVKIRLCSWGTAAPAGLYILKIDFFFSAEDHAQWLSLLQKVQQILPSCRMRFPHTSLVS